MFPLGEDDDDETVCYDKGSGSAIDDTVKLRRPKGPQDLIPSHVLQLNHELSIVIAETCRWSYGVVAVDVWLLTSAGRFERPLRQMWVDPIYFQNDNPTITKALQSLTDPSHKEFTYELSLGMDEGLPGVVWAQPTTTASPRCRNASLSALQDEDDTEDNTIQWNDININIHRNGMDHEESNVDRNLRILVDAGFQRAGGVRFQVRGVQGIVVFLTRGSVDTDKLTSRLNVEYLLTSTRLIGSVLALRQPLALSMDKRTKEAKAALRKVWNAVVFIVRTKGSVQQSLAQQSLTEAALDEGITSDSDMNTKKPRGVTVITTRIILWLQAWASKMTMTDPPPSMSIRQTFQMDPRQNAFTFVATFVTFGTVWFTNIYLKETYGVGIQLGNAAAVTNMVYALTASPAAQPRNILWGQSVAMLCAVTFGMLASSYSDMDPSSFGWMASLSLSLSVSVSISLNEALGITHPNAGSIATAFAVYGHDRWRRMAAQQMCNSIITVLASVLNNLDSGRQYPTFWGYIPQYLSNKIRQTSGQK